MSNLATITNNILADSGIDDLNVIVSTGSYADPAWITSLAWTKITGAPAAGIAGTIATGQVAFGTAANTVGGSNNLFWDNANGRLGVGTNAPSNPLHINAPVGTDGFDAIPLLFIRNTNVTNSFVSSMIGLAKSTGDMLDGFGARLLFSIADNTFGDRTNQIAAIGGVRSGADNSGSLIFQTATTGSNTTKIQVFPTGNVLIQNGGTFTDAGFRLDVNGTARVQGNLTTNLTQGSVPFIGASGLLTQNNSLFFISSFTDLGIGTNTPRKSTFFSRALTVESNGITGTEIVGTQTNLTGTVAAISFINNSNTNTTFQKRLAQITTINDGAAENGNLSFGVFEGGTFRQPIYIKSTGNVGINTITPANTLDVNGTARVQGVLTTTADAVVNGVSVGRGGGAIASNTRVGESALSSNTTGDNNSAFGVGSGFNNLTGFSNVFLGVNAGRFIADGTTANSITNTSIYIGNVTKALASNQSNQIVIGHSSTGLGSNTTVIGNSSTTFGRWFGNLLLGSSSNTGQQLQVTGTTLLNGLSTIQGTTASDTAPLGSELATTGTGTNWAGTDFATGYTHTIGSTAALTTTLAAVVSTFYQITYTVTGRTTGSFAINFGGTTTSGITATGAIGPLALSTATLDIIPTTDFNGTIVLSVRTIGISSASVTLTTSAGNASNHIRISSSITNTFVGLNTGRRNTTGINNTIIGSNAGIENTTGTNNSFFGQASALRNTTGRDNSFFGSRSGEANTIGVQNSFFGSLTGFANTTGNNNSFFGQGSGFANTTGSSNSFFGSSSGQGNTTGGSNAFFGENAAVNNTTGSQNSVFGRNAGRFIANGTTANTITNNSVFIGFDSRANASSQTNQIVIGHTAIGLGSNTTVIGNSSTTFGRWFGNLLIGTSTNNGTNLRVVGTTQSDIITQNLASHGKKVLQYGPTSSTTINLPTEFPLMTGLVVANTYAVFGKYVGKNLSYSQAIEFYISKNPNGFWNTVAYSNSSQFIANLVDVTGSGNDLTITTSTNTSFILELTVMTQA